uniref:Uncharacterized protein n=1 Tax=Tetranychus urticae TaxID=32264 RepID=T1KSC8_TETUR
MRAKLYYLCKFIRENETIYGLSRRICISIHMQLPANAFLMRNWREEMVAISLNVVRLENDRFVNLRNYGDLAEVIEKVCLPSVNGECHKLNISMFQK